MMDAYYRSIGKAPTLLLSISFAGRYTGLVGPRFLICVGARHFS